VDLKNFKTAGENVQFADPQIQQYRDEIVAAYKATGIPPEIIGAQMWHESRGNMGVASTNSDGTRDIGLMQIGQARAEGYLRHFGVSGSLDVTKPADNIMAGALELKYWLQQSGGDLRGALNGYVSGDVRGGNGIGDPNYASNCLRYIDLISQGQSLPQND
jgi:soluble lytic murein transglycosylase-like protein